MNLVTPDPYRSVYDYKSMEEPGFAYGFVPIEKWKVDSINGIIKELSGTDVVKTERDWNAVAQLVVFFIRTFPEEWKQFRDTIPDIRETRREGGYSRSKEIKYVGALPFRLERMIKICFPYQQFNKEFVYKFVKRFKIFQVGGA